MHFMREKKKTRYKAILLIIYNTNKKSVIAHQELKFHTDE